MNYHLKYTLGQNNFDLNIPDEQDARSNAFYDMLVGVIKTESYLCLQLVSYK